MHCTLAQLLLLLFAVGCGVEEAYAPRHRTHPSHSFSDFAKDETSVEKCNNGMSQSCARIDVTGFAAFGRKQQLKGLRTICESNGKHKIITISNALGSASTFEIRIKMPIESRGTFNCVSQNLNNCELLGYSGGTQFSSAQGKGCTISLIKNEPLEASIFCESLKTFKSEITIAEGSRFSCSD